MHVNRPQWRCNPLRFKELEDMAPEAWENFGAPIGTKVQKRGQMTK